MSEYSDVPSHSSAPCTPRRKKVAIVSSYNTACGIAYNAERVQHHLKKFYDVEVLTVDIEMMRRTATRSLVKAGDRHMRDITNKLREYDYVNIQLESGVYGRYLHHAWPRLHHLIANAGRPILITMHCTPQLHPTNLKAYLGRLLRNPISGIALYFFRLRETYHVRRFLDLCRILANRKQLSLVVYNKEELKRLGSYLEIPRVTDHPLCYFDRDERAFYKRKDTFDWKKKLGLSENDLLIGVFGFMAPYKGFVDAIRALTYLPSHVKLAIFGGANIIGVTIGKSCDPSVQSARDLVRALGLEQRVIFVGATTDDEMCYAMAQIDCAVLSYAETHQVASGPGTFAIELASNIITSDVKVFNHYNRYWPGRITTYDIGNSLHLAQIIQSLPLHSAIDVPYLPLNIETQSMLYRDIWQDTYSFEVQ